MNEEVGGGGGFGVPSSLNHGGIAVKTVCVQTPTAKQPHSREAFVCGTGCDRDDAISTTTTTPD